MKITIKEDSNTNFLRALKYINRLFPDNSEVTFITGIEGEDDGYRIKKSFLAICAFSEEMYLAEYQVTGLDINISNSVGVEINAHKLYKVLNKMPYPGGDVIITRLKESTTVSGSSFTSISWKESTIIDND